MKTHRRSRRIRAIGRAVGNGALVQALERRTLFAGHVNPHIDPHIINDARKNPELDGEQIAYDPTIPTGPDAPPTTGTIEGINFDTQAATSGFYNIPPDNNGAV